jgi:hypothetical protein
MLSHYLLLLVRKECEISQAGAKDQRDGEVSVNP